MCLFVCVCVCVCPLTYPAHAFQVDRSGDGDFERGDDGRMVIAEEEDGGRGGKRALKRGRPAEDSDGDSGDDDGDSLGALTQVFLHEPCMTCLMKERGGGVKPMS